MLCARILCESCGCRSHVTKDSGLPGCYVRTSISGLDVSKEPVAFTLKVSLRSGVNRSTSDTKSNSKYLKPGDINSVDLNMTSFTTAFIKPALRARIYSLFDHTIFMSQ